MQRITAKPYENTPNRREIRALYTSAFPKEERLPFFALRALTVREGCNITAYYDGDTFCGFTYDAVRGDILYLMFFAVNGALRGKGYGSAILSYLKEQYPDKAIVLNIELLDPDAENYDDRVRRLRFYEKNGFHDTGYNIDEVGGTFRILSTAKDFVPDAYLAVFKWLSFGIWRPRITKV
jgi:GNAT superfamily N-acetyltransferase